MCQHREHKFRLTISPAGYKPFDLVVQAKGISDAVAQADAYAHKHYPNTSVDFSVGRMGYSSWEVAIEHGAHIKLELG